MVTRDDISEDSLVRKSGIGYGVLIFVPYIANLCLAWKIKKWIGDNDEAQKWFNSYNPIFTALVVLSGDCYTALCVVSSNVFGLKILSCGFTQYELRKLGKIRIIGFVLENIPQLIFQILYTVALVRIGDKITPAVFAVLSASLLSIISISLSYLIERDASNATAVEFHVMTRCSSDKSIKFDFAASLPRDALDSDESILLSPSRPTQSRITPREKRTFADNCGRTQALGKEIAGVFGIHPKNIEVGNSKISEGGAETYIVCYVYDGDIKDKNMDINGKSVRLTPVYYVAQKFEEKQIAINGVFRKHFSLGQDFEVRLVWMKVGGGPKAMYTNKISQEVKDQVKMNLIEDIKSYFRNFSIREERDQDQFFDEVKMCKKRNSMDLGVPVKRGQKFGEEAEEDVNNDARVLLKSGVTDQEMNVEMIVLEENHKMLSGKK